VIAHLAQEGYSPEYGARPLKRTIQQLVMVPISQYLLKNPEAKHFSLQLKNNKITIV
jgi:ATP-dependent Clp protease ATP-binding subunit ClpA